MPRIDDARAALRTVRDLPAVSWALRQPLRALQRAGVRVPPSIYRHVPYRGEFEVKGGGEPFRMRAHGNVIENTLYWEGALAYDAEAMRAWARLARRARVVLDVGANTGVYALNAAASGGRPTVHAFEALERIAALTRANVALNPHLDVRVHGLAASDRCGTARIHDPGGDNCYSASLDPDFLRGEKTAREVETVSVDAFVARERLAQVDLVKLDVEGHERAVLEGMRETLARFSPTLFMELLPRLAHDVAFVERLVADGYAFFLLTGDGPVRSERVQPSPRFRNVVLCRREADLAELAALAGAHGRPA